MRSLCSRAVLLNLAVAILPAQPQSLWPQFRGPGGSATGDGKPPVEFGAGKSLLWKTEIPDGQSSPVLSKDMIVITAGARNSRKLETLALDRKTGNLLWRKSLIAEKIENLRDVGSPATGSAAVDEERI